MDRSVLQKIRIWLNLHSKLNTNTNEDIQAFQKTQFLWGKKEASHFHIGLIFLVRQNEAWIHPSEKPRPLTTQRYQANHQAFRQREYL